MSKSVGAAMTFEDDLSVNEVAKALGVKSKPKQAQKRAVERRVKVKSGKDSSLDVAWTMFSSMLVLLGRLLKVVWKFRVGILAAAFVVQNGLTLVHQYHVFFR